ncbi:unnamed protein product [Sphagnum troendelagicum]
MPGVETAAYRLTRSKSNVCINPAAAPSPGCCCSSNDHSSSCPSSVLQAGHMSTSSSLTCYRRNYNSSYAASSKNSSAGSGKYASTTVIAVFIGIIVFTFLWIVYCTLEQEEEEAVATAASWKQIDRNGLVITLPHDTPFKVLHNSKKGGSSSSSSSNFVVAGEEETTRVLLKKKKVFKVVEKELVQPQASAAELHGPALQGMGQLFRRGRWAMSELLIAHLSESTSVEDLRLFLRSLHRSGVPARADVVLLFPWRPLPLGMAAMIDQEDESFRKLLLRSSLQRGDSAISRAPNSTSSSSSSSSSSSIISVFNAAAYWRSAETFFSAGNKVRVAEPVWGSSNINTAHSRSSSSSSSAAARKVHKDNWGGWGSVVGFDVQELDPGDTLRGFLDPPAELRRWVCYQILLGTLRHKYRNVLLTEAQGVFVLGDPLAPARRKSGSLFLFAHESRKWSDPASNILLSPGPPQSADDHQIHLQRDLIEPGDHIVMMDPSEQQLEEGEEDMSGRLKILLLDSTEGKPKTGSVVMRMLMDSTTSSIRPLMRAGLIEEIYGTEIWNGLEKEDRDRKVLSTGIVMGGIRPVRSLANAMATEMVKVALKRKTRQPFHDEALLNFLIIRSSVLRQKVKSHLHIMVDSKDLSSSGVHLLLPGSSSSSSSSSNHTSAAAVFFQKNGLTRYAIVQGCKAEEIGEERRKEITLALHIDICNSSTATATTVATSTQVYSDCKLQF